MSAATLFKADRLLVEGAVEPMPFPVTQFRVRGDHGAYVVFVSATSQLCSCPAAGRCSHSEAAIKWVNAGDDAKSLMEVALERRKAEGAVAAEDVFARLEA